MLLLLLRPLLLLLLCFAVVVGAAVAVAAVVVVAADVDVVVAVAVAAAAVVAVAIAVHCTDAVAAAAVVALVAVAAVAVVALAAWLNLCVMPGAGRDTTGASGQPTPSMGAVASSGAGQQKEGESVETTSNSDPTLFVLFLRLHLSAETVHVPATEQSVLPVPHRDTWIAASSLPAATAAAGSCQGVLSEG